MYISQTDRCKRITVKKQNVPDKNTMLPPSAVKMLRNCCSQETNID